MTVTESLARRVEAQLAPDPARVVAKLFLPGEELPLGRSRAGAVIARVLALPEDEVERVAASLLVDFSQRHRDYFDMLADHASMMRLQVQSTPAMSEARSLVLGASFTAEYAVEGAALCNPSAVLHPDQSGLARRAGADRDQPARHRRRPYFVGRDSPAQSWGQGQHGPSSLDRCQSLPGAAPRPTGRRCTCERF